MPHRIALSAPCKDSEPTPPAKKLPRQSPAKNWQRGTISVATPGLQPCLIAQAQPEQRSAHRAKPVNQHCQRRISVDRVPRRTGREEPFLLPFVTESTTTSSQVPAAMPDRTGAARAARSAPCKASQPALPAKTQPRQSPTKNWQRGTIFAATSPARPHKKQTIFLAQVKPLNNLTQP